MKDEREILLEKINSLIDTLAASIERYNAYVRPILSTEAEIEDCEQVNDLEREKKLKAQLRLFTQKVESPEVTQLNDSIESQKIEIERLDRLLFGRSDRASPLFLQHRTLPQPRRAALTK